MVELVDTLDLKSNDHCDRAGSSPAPSTIALVNYLIFKGYFFILLFCTIYVRPDIKSQKIPT